jgi:transcriptional regulator with PAS, ATPase and Fis domain
MIDLVKMFDNVEVAIVASDPDFNIIYMNKRAKKLYKEQNYEEDLVGTSLIECHKPETMDKITKLFQEFRNKEKKFSYYIGDIPWGKETVVQVPFYNNGVLAGVVEFHFESILA